MGKKSGKYAALRFAEEVSCDEINYNKYNWLKFFDDSASLLLYTVDKTAFIQAKEVLMLKVLMIDSLPEQSSLIRDMLEDWGHSVAVESSCAKALVNCPHETWHLVFVGEEKLSLEGVEWIPRIRRSWPDALLIVIGDLDQPDFERRVRTQGVDFYLQKASDLPRLKILMQHFEANCFNHQDVHEEGLKILASEGRNLSNRKELS